MNKSVCLGLILLLVLVVSLASGCFDPSMNSNVKPTIEGELILLQHDNRIMARPGYRLFIKGQTYPREIEWDRIEFIYDAQVKNPRVEIFGRSSGRIVDEARVWFRDETQFREYFK